MAPTVPPGLSPTLAPDLSPHPSPRPADPLLPGAIRGVAVPRSQIRAEGGPRAGRRRPAPQRASDGPYPRGVVPRPSSRPFAPRLRAGLVRDGRGGVVLHGEGSPLRLGPWQGDPEVAYVVPVHGGSPSAVTDVRRALELAGEQGYRSVVTAALAPLDQAAFLTVGFEVHERLHLLARALPVAPPRVPGAPAGVVLRRGHTNDRDSVLRLDHQAFEPFWRLDHRGLADAIAATPSARFRVAVADRGSAAEVVGYSIIGRASHRGYVQRLAVAPDRHRGGVGRSLLADGLRWLERRRVRRVMVNTQERNAAALALYEREGFERQPGGLAVLSLPLREAT